MKSILFTAILAISLSSCAQSNEQTPGTTAKHVNVSEFAQFKTRQEAQLLDVRTPGEFAQGHIPGAFNYNVNDAGFMKNAETLDKNKPVYVYCRSGARSSNAMNQLKKAGFKEVYNLQGGIMAWGSEGREVSK